MITWTGPPSTLQAAPATYEARSEHRKRIASAISPTSARRPIGRPAPAAASASSRLRPPPISADWSRRPPRSIHSSDLVGPGQTALTRTPSAAYASANTRDSDSSAALVTEYSGVIPDGGLPADEHTFTILPQPRSAMPGAATRIARSGAITFSSQAACQSSSGTCSSERRFDVPALLTRTSSWPKLSVAAATMRSPASVAVTSSGTGCAWPPRCPQPAAASSRGPAERATSSTLAPSPHSRMASSRPIPRLAPVIAQALPSSPRSTSDQLDPVLDRQLGLVAQRPVDGALSGDHLETLDLVLAQSLRQPQDDDERPRHA